MKTIICTPWHNPDQITAFRQAWQVEADDPRFVFQQDTDKSGCAKTKNRGIQMAMERGAEIVIVLDDDCYPTEGMELDDLIERHCANLFGDWAVPYFMGVTKPLSRGTPYLDENRHMYFPAACSMGFWEEIGDYCGARQLSFESEQMRFGSCAIHGAWFPLSGMNIAFRPKEWWPWCQFIDVPRFDDIWMGWLWMKEAYRRGYCFNLRGPSVRHVRQSNVWKNLQLEAVHLERNETLWRDIATSPAADYETLRALLPV